MKLSDIYYGVNILGGRSNYESFNGKGSKQSALSYAKQNLNNCVYAWVERKEYYFDCDKPSVELVSTFKGRLSPGYLFTKEVLTSRVSSFCEEVEKFKTLPDDLYLDLVKHLCNTFAIEKAAASTKYSFVESEMKNVECKLSLDNQISVFDIVDDKNVITTFKYPTAVTSEDFNKDVLDDLSVIEDSKSFDLYSAPLPKINVDKMREVFGALTTLKNVCQTYAVESKDVSKKSEQQKPSLKDKLNKFIMSLKEKHLKKLEAKTEKFHNKIYGDDQYLTYEYYENAEE